MDQNSFNLDEKIYSIWWYHFTWQLVIQRVLSTYEVHLCYSQDKVTEQII